MNVNAHVYIREPTRAYMFLDKGINVTTSVPQAQTSKVCASGAAVAKLPALPRPKHGLEWAMK